MPRTSLADVDALALHVDEALIRSVLGQPRVVHDRAWALAIGEARFFHRLGARGEDKIGCDAVFVVTDAHPQALQRLDHLDRDGADARIHPLHVEQARGAQIVLHAVHDHRERGIHHVQMRIDAQRAGEEHARRPAHSR